MKGFIEIKEDAYEDTIEHLYRLKKLACKMISKLSEDSEIYSRHLKDHEDGEDDEFLARGRMRRNRGGRYEYGY